MGRIPNGFIIFSPKGNVFLNSMTIFSVQFKILGNGISQSFTLSLKSGHPPFMLATHLNLTVKRKKFGLTLSINYFFFIFRYMNALGLPWTPSISFLDSIFNVYMLLWVFFESYLGLFWHNSPQLIHRFKIWILKCWFWAAYTFNSLQFT